MRQSDRLDATRRYENECGRDNLAYKSEHKMC